MGLTFTIPTTGLGQAVNEALGSLSSIFYIAAGLIVAGMALSWGIDMLKSWQDRHEEESLESEMEPHELYEYYTERNDRRARWYEEAMIERTPERYYGDELEEVAADFRVGPPNPEKLEDYADGYYDDNDPWYSDDD